MTDRARYSPKIKEPVLKSITVDVIYSGDKDTDGSWRLRRVGSRWVSEYRASGTWTPKGGFSA